MDTAALSVIYSRVTTLPEKGYYYSPNISKLCMDPRRPRATNPPNDRHQLQGRRSSPALHQLQTPNRRGPQPYSSPLPQTQWAEIPSPYRPRDLLEPEGYQHRYDPRYAHSRAHPPPAERFVAAEDRPEQSQQRQRRRIRGFRDLLQRDVKDEGRSREVNVSMLYPQLNPYSQDNRIGTYRGADDLGRHHTRTASQRSAPEYLDAPSHSDSPSPLNAPRSPTYPPAGRRRIHSSTGVSDAAFADEAEYRLFVEATAGLGPEQQTFHPSDLVSPLASSPPRRTQSERISTIDPIAQRDVISPLSDTPTTRFALQQLAQMPHHSSWPSLEPLQTTHSAVDMWVQPPSAEPVDMLDEAFAELELENEGIDEELPGYAESQAQAQQHQRAAAARRAQELQMRWQLSGGRRGV